MNLTFRNTLFERVEKLERWQRRMERQTQRQFIYDRIRSGIRCDSDYETLKQLDDEDMQDI